MRCAHWIVSSCCLCVLRYYMSLSDFLEENCALDALDALEDAGIERISDMESLNADDLRSLGLSRRLSSLILSQPLDDDIEEDAPTKQEEDPLSSPPQRRIVSNGSALSTWLISNDLDEAAGPLADAGYERLADLRQITAEDLAVFGLSEAVQYRLHASLASAHAAGRWNTHARLGVRFAAVLALSRGRPDSTAASAPPAAEPPIVQPIVVGVPVDAAAPAPSATAAAAPSSAAVMPAPRPARSHELPALPPAPPPQPQAKLPKRAPPAAASQPLPPPCSRTAPVESAASGSRRVVVYKPLAETKLGVRLWGLAGKPVKMIETAPDSPLAGLVESNDVLCSINGAPCDGGHEKAAEMLRDATGEVVLVVTTRPSRWESLRKSAVARACSVPPRAAVIHTASSPEARAVAAILCAELEHLEREVEGRVRASSTPRGAALAALALGGGAPSDAAIKRARALPYEKSAEITCRRHSVASSSPAMDASRSSIYAAQYKFLQQSEAIDGPMPTSTPLEVAAPPIAPPRPPRRFSRAASARAALPAAAAPEREGEGEPRRTTRLSLDMMLGEGPDSPPHSPRDPPPPPKLSAPPPPKLSATVSDRRRRSSVAAPPRATLFMPPPQIPPAQAERRGSVAAGGGARRTSVGAAGALSPWERLRAQHARVQAAKDPLGQGAAAAGALRGDDDDEPTSLALHANRLWSGMVANIQRFLEQDDSDRSSRNDEQCVASERARAIEIELEREHAARMDERFSTPSALLHRSSGGGVSRLKREAGGAAAVPAVFAANNGNVGAGGATILENLGSSLAVLLSPQPQSPVCCNSHAPSTMPTASHMPHDRSTHGT